MFRDFEFGETLTLTVAKLTLIDVVVPALLFAALAVLVLGPLNPRRTAPTTEPRESRWPALPGALGQVGLTGWPRPVAWAALALWTVLFLAFVAGIFWVLASLFLRGPEGADAAEKAGDLRWYLLTLTALTAAAGGVIALPFTLIRTGFNARQTLATEEGLVTDRINAAVESLGAEKEVNHIGRMVTIVHGGGETTEFVEFSDDIKDFDENWQVHRADWQPLTLTKPNLEVRIGAILALERIARKNADVHVQVMQILCAYVRENAKAQETEPLVEAPREPIIPVGYDLAKCRAEWSTWRSSVRLQYRRLPRSREPRIDIQTALAVLGRREPRQREIEARWQGDNQEGACPFDAPYPELPECPEGSPPQSHADCEKIDACVSAIRDRNEIYRNYSGYRLDLRGTDLRGYDLSHGNWSGARLDGTNLQAASVRNAWLRGADLGGATIAGANFEGSALQGANLRGVNGLGAKLTGSVLNGAQVSEADLRGANLGGARAVGADFYGTALKAANLRVVRFARANLMNAQIQFTEWNEAHLPFSYFGYAAMTGAIFVKVDMKGVSFGKALMNGVYLVEARMEGASLADADMQDVFIDRSTFDDASLFNPDQMRGSAVRRTDLRRISLSADVLDDTFGDSSVTLPEGTEPPAGWESKEVFDDVLFRKRWRAFQAQLGDATEADNGQG